MNLPQDRLLEVSTAASFTDMQRRALAIVPKVTASLSMIGSTWIVAEVLRDREKRRSTYNRIMGCMSFYDLINSFFIFLSTWPVPADTIFEVKPYGALGNQLTCTIQGFFIQLTDLKLMYNGVLAIYYLLIFRYRWKKRAMIRFEAASHIFILVLSLGTSIASLPLQLYNNAFLWCWISPKPMNCEVDGIDENCERGQNAQFYRVLFCYFWLLATWIVILLAMSLLYYTAWAQAQRMKRYATGRDAAERNKHQILRLSSYYVLSFFITYFFPTATRIVQFTGGIPPFFIYLLFVTFVPMQGIWNVMVFLIPRFHDNRSENPEWTFGKTVKETLMRCMKSRRETLGAGPSLDEDSMVCENCQASNAVTIVAHESVVRQVPNSDAEGRLTDT